MRTSSLLFFAVLICTGLSAQKITADKVPASVASAFKTKFPAAEKIKWEIEDKTDYEANFDLKSEECSAKFDKDGKWLETETEIKVSQLPTAVQQSLTKNFKDYKIKEAEQVDLFDKGRVYEIEIEKGEETYEVQFSLSGEVIKKTTEKKEKY